MMDEKVKEQFERQKRGAVDEEKFQQIVTFLSNAETNEEAKTSLLLFGLDKNFHRADLCLAMKVFERAKGWTFG